MGCPKHKKSSETFFSNYLLIGYRFIDNLYHVASFARLRSALVFDLQLTSAMLLDPETFS